MKIIGKQVHVIPPTAKNPRSGEGDFVRLPDGRIMFAYSEYCTSERHDNSPSQISAVFSSDEGESFGDYRVLIPPSEEVFNRMCVSFLAMQNGDIGMFYGEKHMGPSGRVHMRLMLSRTKDGVSFSEPVNCTPGIKYSVIENARVIRLSSGRILIPSNDHSWSEDKAFSHHGIAEFFYSDDDGRSFHKFPTRLDSPFDNLHTGLQETGLIEIEGERVLAFSRTSGVCQFVCISENGGETFSQPEPAPFFTSPTSIMHMRHMPNNKTIAVWNPIPPTPMKLDDGPEQRLSWRTPLVCATVEGKGEKFLGDIFSVPAKVFLLEDDNKNSYCYPCLFMGKDYFLCAYYHSYDTGFMLSACVIKKVLFSEMEEM